MCPRRGGAGVLLVGCGMPASDSAKDLRGFADALVDCRQVVPAGLFGHVKNKRALRTQARNALVPILQDFWTPEGWPYDYDCMRLVQGLNGLLSDDGAVVRCGMHVGGPGIAEGVRKLSALGCDSLVVLPLDSHSTPPFLRMTEERVRSAVEKVRFRGMVTFVKGYSTNPVYLRALAASILYAGFSAQKRDRVLLLFPSMHREVLHGAEEQVKSQCNHTARAVAALLGVEDDRVSVAFVRPFSAEQDWMGPFATDVLAGDWPSDASAACMEGGRTFLTWPGVAVDGALHRFDLGRSLADAFDVVCVPALGRSRANLKVLQAVILEAMKQEGVSG